MVIQQKKKFKSKRFYFFRRKYRYYKKFPKKKKLLIFRNKIKKRKISKFTKRKMMLRFGSVGFVKRYTFRYIRQRMDAIRVMNYLWRYKWWVKKYVWRKKYKKGFKLFYKKFAKKSRNKLGHYRIASKFYSRFGLLPLMVQIIKYSRLRYKLKKAGKVFRRKKKKKIVFIHSVLQQEKPDRMTFLNIFFQSLISRGKKKLSLKIFFEVFTLLKFKFKNEFITKYFMALEKIRPLINYRTMFIGGKKYRIPVLMPVSKSYNVGIRWLINNSSGSGNNCISCLFNDINSSLKNEGAIIKHRKEYHYASFENKTYIRFLRFLKGGFL